MRSRTAGRSPYGNTIGRQQHDPRLHRRRSDPPLERDPVTVGQYQRGRTHTQFAQTAPRNNFRRAALVGFGPHLPAVPRTKKGSRKYGGRVHDGRDPPAGPAKGRRRNGGPTAPRTTCSAAAAHTLRSAPGCDRHWPIGRKTNASLIPSQSNRLRTHADKNHLMSETQRTAIDIARDHAHSPRDFSELRH